MRLYKRKFIPADRVAQAQELALYLFCLPLEFFSTRVLPAQTLPEMRRGR